MKSIQELSAFRCRMWDLHDRLEDHITEETCKEEIESFSRYGQLVPVLGRVSVDPAYDAELIFGARRLFVARLLNKPLLVDLRESLPDREGIIAMDIENRQRADISPYERGLSYLKWLRTGFFASQDDIARALKVSSSQVSRLLKLARLPSVIVDAFGSPVDICEMWGLELAEALADVSKRQLVLAKARKIASTPKRPPPRDVFRDLIGATCKGRKPPPKNRDEVVKDTFGNPLFRVRRQTNTIALLLPIDSVSASTMEKIRISLTGILQPATVQPQDLGEESLARRALIRVKDNASELFALPVTVLAQPYGSPE